MMGELRLTLSPRMTTADIDTLLAQSSERTEAPGESDNRDLDHVAHGLMAIRQTMRRTAPVVACLPTAWESIRARATATVEYAWTLKRVGLVEKTTTVQKWEERDREWLLVSETRKKGSPLTLFDELASR